MSSFPQSSLEVLFRKCRPGLRRITQKCIGALKDKSISGTLADQIYGAQVSLSEKKNARQNVLRQTCSHLEAIHKAIIRETSSKDPDQQDVTFDSSLYSAVMALVDLLTLEGIYPSLPQGAVSPAERRKKSLLYTKVPPQAPLSENLQFSNYILLHAFIPILLDEQQGVQPFLRERIISDIVIGNANLAFMPDSRIDERTYFAESLHRILDSLPTQTVYRLLTPFIKQSVPEWLRSPMTEIVALLPTRPNGVRHTINFIASSYPAPPDAQANKDVRPSLGPPLHMEALTQMAKVLSSIPKSTTPEVYLPVIVKQLQDLLDGEGGPELGRAAGYIIASGILGKRSIGAPGSIGWKLIAEPILNAINPPESVVQAQSFHTQASNVGSDLGLELVSQVVFDQALTRLVTIISSHPNPGITARLLRPLILPLWGLANYNESPMANSFYKETALSLLETYFRLSGSFQQLQLLAGNVTWRGTKDWTFASGSEGGIAIRKREEHLDGAEDFISQLSRIDAGISTFVNLLGRASIDDSVMSSLLLDLTKRWLPRTPQPSNSISIAGKEDPLQWLAVAKLAEAILKKFQDRILKEPSQLLQLLEQVLQEEVQLRMAESERKQKLISPTISSLSSIVADETNLSSPPGENEVSGLLSDRNYMLQIVVSLVNTILAGSGQSLASKAPVATTINGIQSLLHTLIQEPNRITDTSLIASIRTTLSLIDFTASASTTAQPNPPSSATTAPNSVLATFTQIQTDLQSDLPPIRISALQTLSELVSTPTTPLDIASTTVLLLRTIRTDDDEYVSLAAIRVLVELASKRDLRFVTAMVCDAFQDAKEVSGVDGRLRVGEAMSNLVDGAVDTFGDRKGVDVATRGIAFRAVAEVCVVVAGRRGRRSREMEERMRKERLERRKRKKAEKAWGGEVPPRPTEEEEKEEEMTEEQKARRERELEAIEKIVKGWEDTGFEDVRIRVSAISVLGHVLEMGLDRLTDKVVDDAVDMALNILVMEQEPSKAIVRRASVLIVLSLLKALNALHEEGSASGVNLESQKWTTVERVLRWTADMDDDDMTKQHAETVLESLENWRIRQLFALGMENADVVPRLGLEGRLRGLDVDPDGASDSAGKMHIEEIG